MSPSSDFPLDAYLRRIGYEGSREPSAGLLKALHRAQAFAIPFENIDPLTGHPVDLQPAALAAKMIDRQRGGYCFELNGLFLLALQALGFQTTSLMARVEISLGNYSMRCHQITLVESGGQRWIADVGFGGNGLLEALPLEPGAEVDQGLDCYRIMEDAVYGYRLEHRLPARWRTLYAFSLDPFLFLDYQMASYFTSRSPEAIFTRIPLCARPREDSRVILFGNQLKIRRLGAETTAIPVETADALRNVLAEYFEIEWPAEAELPVPQPPPPGSREV